MLVRYTSEEIQALVKEPKHVERGTFSSINWLDREGHKRADIDVEGDDGNLFAVKLRKNRINRSTFPPSWVWRSLTPTFSSGCAATTGSTGTATK